MGTAFFEAFVDELKKLGMMAPPGNSPSAMAQPLARLPRPTTPQLPQIAGQRPMFMGT